MDCEETTCLACKNNRFLDRFNQCVETCGVGYYDNGLDFGNKKCDECSSNCISCKESECIECERGY